MTKKYTARGAILDGGRALSIIAAARDGIKTGAIFAGARGAGGSIFTVGQILTRGEKRTSENIENRT